MALSNEMRRLTENFLEAYDDRFAAVATICNDTARELSGFRATHEHMALEQRQRLTNYMNGLRDNVSTLMNSMNAQHNQMAIEQRRRLAQNVSCMRDNVSMVLKSLNTAHEKMAVEQRQHLADYVDKLRDNVTTVLKTLDRAHENMATAQRKHMAADRANLASGVSKMRGAAQADQKEANKTWNSFNSAMQRRRAKSSASASASKPAASANAAKPAPKPSKPATKADDLTNISGIGPSWQQRLNGIGIFTFAQLAASTSPKIRNAFGAAGRLAKVEDWIKEAARRS